MLNVCRTLVRGSINLAGSASFCSHLYPKLAASFARTEKVASDAPETKRAKKKSHAGVNQDENLENQQSTISEIPSLFSALSETLPTDSNFTGLPTNQNSKQHQLSRQRPGRPGRPPKAASNTKNTTENGHSDAQNTDRPSDDYIEYVRFGREYSTLAWKQTLDPRASETWTKMLDNQTAPNLPEVVALVETLELVLSDRQLRELTPDKVLSLIARRIVAALRKPDIKKRLSTNATFVETGLPKTSIGKLLYFAGKVAGRLPFTQETKSSLLKSASMMETPDVYSLYVLSQEQKELDINWDTITVDTSGELFVFLLLVRRTLSKFVKERNMLRGDKKTAITEKVVSMTKRLEKVIQSFAQSITSGNNADKKAMNPVQAIQTSDLLLSIIMGIMSFQIPSTNLEWVKSCRFLDADRLSCKLILRIYSSSVTLVVNEDAKTEIDEEEIDNEENLLAQVVVADNKLRMTEYTAKLIKKGLEQNWDFEERLELLALAARDNIKHLDLAFKVPTFIDVLNSFKSDLTTFQLRIDQLHKIVNSCWKMLGIRRLDILRTIEELHQHSANKFIFDKIRVTVRYHDKKKDMIAQIDGCFRSMGKSLSRLIGEGELNVATAYRIMFMLLAAPEPNTRAINQLQFALADSISKGSLSLRDKRKLKLINKYYYASQTGSRKLRDLINMTAEGGADAKSIEKAVAAFLKTKQAMLKAEPPK